MYVCDWVWFYAFNSAYMHTFYNYVYYPCFNSWWRLSIRHWSFYFTILTLFVCTLILVLVLLFIIIVIVTCVCNRYILFDRHSFGTLTVWLLPELSSSLCRARKSGQASLFFWKVWLTTWHRFCTFAQIQKLMGEPQRQKTTAQNVTPAVVCVCKMGTRNPHHAAMLMIMLTSMRIDNWWLMTDCSSTSSTSSHRRGGGGGGSSSSAAAGVLVVVLFVLFLFLVLDPVDVVLVVVLVDVVMSKSNYTHNGSHPIVPTFGCWNMPRKDNYQCLSCFQAATSPSSGSPWQGPPRLCQLISVKDYQTMLAKTRIFEFWVFFAVVLLCCVFFICFVFQETW